MRSSSRLSSGIVTALALAATPAQAQFSEDSYQNAGSGEPSAVHPGDDYAHDAATGTDPYADPYAADPYQDPYAPASGTAAQTGPLQDRTVGDVAAGILGTKGARYVSDAEAVMREVAGNKGALPDGSGASPSVLSVVRDLVRIGKKKKDGGNPQ